MVCVVLVSIDHEVPPFLKVCLVSVWLEELLKQWPTAGEGCLSFDVSAPYWSCAYSENQKKASKAWLNSQRLCLPPKHGRSDSVNKQSRWWPLGLTPPAPSKPQTEWSRLYWYFNAMGQYNTQFDWHWFYLFVYFIPLEAKKSCRKKSLASINIRS